MSSIPVVPGCEFSRTGGEDVCPLRRRRTHAYGHALAHAPRDQEVSKVRAAHQGAASPEVRENPRRSSSIPDDDDEVREDPRRFFC